MIPRRKHWIGNDWVELCHLKSSTKYKRRLHSITPPACLESIKIKSNFRRKLHISLWLISWSPGKMCLQTHHTPAPLDHIWDETVSKHIANILAVSSWWMCCKYRPFCRPPSLNELNHFRAGNWSLQGPDTKPQEELCGVVASIWALSRYWVLISRSVLPGHCCRIMGES